MERLTRSNINVDPDTDRFLNATIGGKEIDWKQFRDSTLNVLINGPTSNGFGKDIFRKMARDLYGRLKALEDTGWTPEMLHKLGENAGHMWDFAQAAENMTVGRLKELAEADKDGRVVVLPCKPGAEVWVTRHDKVWPMYFVAPTLSAVCPDMPVHCQKDTCAGGPCKAYFGTDAKEFGKTVFLSREEAEKHMEEAKK